MWRERHGRNLINRPFSPSWMENKDVRERKASGSRPRINRGVQNGRSVPRDGRLRCVCRAFIARRVSVPSQRRGEKVPSFSLVPGGGNSRFGGRGERAEGERLAERGTRPPRGCSKAVHSFRIKILKKCMFTCFLSEVRGSTSQCFVQRVDIF